MEKLTLTDEFVASLGHRYCEETVGFGHNMKVRLTWAGVPAANKLSSAFLRETCLKLKGLLDHRCLHEDYDWFSNHPGSLENITLFLRDQLLQFGIPPQGQWQLLRVDEDRDLACEWSFPNEKLSLIFRFPMHVTGKQDQQWGGGTWMVHLYLQGQLDSSTGLLYSRTIKQELLRIAHSLSQQLWTLGEVDIAQEAARRFKTVQGFSRIEFQVRPSLTFAAPH